MTWTYCSLHTLDIIEPMLKQFIAWNVLERICNTEESNVYHLYQSKLILQPLDNTDLSDSRFWVICWSCEIFWSSNGCMRKPRASGSAQGLAFLSHSATPLLCVIWRSAGRSCSQGWLLYLAGTIQNIVKILCTSFHVKRCITSKEYQISQSSERLTKWSWLRLLLLKSIVMFWVWNRILLIER